MFSKIKYSLLLVLTTCFFSACEKTPQPLQFEGKLTAEIDGKVIIFPNVSVFEGFWGDSSITRDISNITFFKKIHSNEGSIRIFTEPNPQIGKRYPIEATKKAAEISSIFCTDWGWAGMTDSARLKAEIPAKCYLVKENKALARSPYLQYWVAGQSYTDDAIGYVEYDKVSPDEISGTFEFSMFSNYVVNNDTLSYPELKVKNGKFSVRRK
jgi:hypothetical protein